MGALSALSLLLIEFDKPTKSATLLPVSTAARRGLIIQEGGLEVVKGGLLVADDGGSISISSTSVDALAVAATSKYGNGSNSLRVISRGQTVRLLLTFVNPRTPGSCGRNSRGTENNKSRRALRCSARIPYIPATSEIVC